jgi:hypothetical protein
MLLKKLFLLFIFIMIIMGSWLSKEKYDNERRLNIARCVNGTYDPCSNHCRNFWSVVFNEKCEPINRRTE